MVCVYLKHVYNVRKFMYVLLVIKNNKIRKGITIKTHTNILVATPPLTLGVPIPLQEDPDVV